MFEQWGIDETAEELKSDLHMGLKTEEAARRLERDGRNEMRAPRKKTIIESFLEQLNDPLIYVLIVAAAVSVLLREVSDAVIIGVVVLIHGVHNVIQAIDLQKENYDKWWIALLFGILTVIFGGVLVYNPFGAVEMVVRMIGIFLIYDGASDMWILSRVFKVKRDKEKIIDAEYVDLDE